jgi:hypothetical protein
MYPQVSSTTLLIFACSKLENNTSWLMADYRIQCWTPRHLAHVGAGAVWTLLFPFGIPVAILLALRRARVPELAAWKRDCAWLRAVVQRALVMGVKLPFGALDPDTVTTESISLEHLRTLHRLFVMGGHGGHGGGGHDDASAGAHLLLQHEAHKPPPASPPPEAGAHASASGPRSSWTRMRGLFALAGSAAAPEADAPAARERRVSALSRRASTVRGSSVGTRGAGKSFSRKASFVAFFWSSERALLLGQLLDWAKSDKRSVIGEPRHTQLRWRTHGEWRALEQDGATLGPRDAAERAAFFKYRFLFADYAVRAWYWETVDLFQKLFFTSLLPFIAPHSSIQIICAILFAFAFVLITIQVKPYRDPANNQLAALSSINIMLFVFCGLLLHVNPDGITSETLLFQVIVGGLTTSIVGFTFILFVRAFVRQSLGALWALEDEEDEADAADEAAFGEGTYGSDGEGGGHGRGSGGHVANGNGYVPTDDEDEDGGLGLAAAAHEGDDGHDAAYDGGGGGGEGEEEEEERVPRRSLWEEAGDALRGGRHSSSVPLVASPPPSPPRGGSDASLGELAQQAAAAAQRGSGGAAAAAAATPPAPAWVTRLATPSAPPAAARGGGPT